MAGLARDKRQSSFWKTGKFYLSNMILPGWKDAQNRTKQCYQRDSQSCSQVLAWELLLLGQQRVWPELLEPREIGPKELVASDPLLKDTFYSLPHWEHSCP